MKYNEFIECRVILTIGRISRWDCATDLARSFTAFRMTHRAMPVSPLFGRGLGEAAILR